MTTTEATAGRKEWIGLAVLILPVLLVSMDITVLYFALPSISAGLEPSGTQQLWMIDIYGFVLAGLLITMGGLGDRIGRRRLLMIGTVVFGAASAAAAFSVSPEMLIIARAAQGVGGATLMPSTLALIRNMFHDKHQRRTAIAVWSIGMSMGSAIGPILSGLLLTGFWWGSIFLINVPVAVLLLVIAPILVPEHRAARSGRFDVWSALLSVAGLVALVWALKEFAVHGMSTPATIALLAGIALGAAFLHRQRVHHDPMIDLALFRTRGVGSAMSANLVCYFGMVGFSMFTTQYLMEVLLMSPLEAALWTLAAPVAIMLTAPVATSLAQRIRPAYILAAGFGVSACGFLLMTQVGLERNLPLVVGGAVCISAGIVIAGSIGTDLVVGSAPPERSGAVSALLQASQELGGALGIAVLGSIGAAVFGRFMESSPTAGLSGEALGNSEETLGGAVEAAKTLPQPQQAELVHTAQEAFVTSLHPVALTGAAVVVAAAVFGAIGLRHIKHSPEPPDVD
ncbi:MFS transporter [Amycolatopsis sp. YIM 10]|uniref:MFS transporter n=1 Tax=Amycolatopsis sp. YIM 10 TaxID=2653857 RepID=UPI0012905990|nr:MFS transporter [Amycolatopsis sp. YIM 10]QFU87497.1 Antiseptic resistance protein [Amycolatopsis sp. YIM 10]